MKKPTLEDMVRMGCKVRARLAKELIGIRVVIESYPLPEPVKAPKENKRDRSTR